jgi:DNA segregation ATPase FtsK/SpoIIIE-like protein
MHTNTPAAGIGAADPLLPQAAAWIARLRDSGQDVVLYPISRLQREFRIGYSRTCALVDALAFENHWIIAFAEDGTRYARLPSGGNV